MSSKIFKRLTLVLCLANFAVLPLAGAEASLGETVYKNVSEAVFLIEVVDANGQAMSLGSAFLVDDQKLVTNYHVIDGGKAYLRVGSVRIDCSVEAVDTKNDLALLRVQGSIAAKPLTLASTETPAGSTVFAMGNPAGLERTISQGLLSGKRELDGRALLQISAPISPGSSGGPVINAQGEVIGVAVAYLRDRQNLNFAVPAPLVADLLAGRTNATTSSLEELLKKAEELSEGAKGLLSGESFDEEALSRVSKEINATLGQAKSLAEGSPVKLLAVAQSAARASSSAVAIAAAKEAIQLSKSPLVDAHRVLAEELKSYSIFREDDGKKAALLEAEVHARKVLELAKLPRSKDYFHLALILEDLGGQAEEAYSNFKKALDTAKTNKESTLVFYYRGLFRMSHALGRRDEAVSWFKLVASGSELYDFDWEELALLFDEEGKFGEAGDAWLQAAALSPAARYYCNAGSSYWSASKNDESLSAYRKCVEKATTEENSEQMTGRAFAAMSAILRVRGVYDESINLARQAIAIDEKNWFAFLVLSKSLNAVGRNSEAVTAAQNAIRLTDGRYAELHFALGAAYFDMENWAQAGKAFEKAAQLDPKEDAAPYNVALCMQRQRFYSDAAVWYEEVLRRRPNHPQREEILKTIKILRN